jgi:hypothetical protein
LQQARQQADALQAEVAGLRDRLAQSTQQETQLRGRQIEVLQRTQHALAAARALLA